MGRRAALAAIGSSAAAAVGILWAAAVDDAATDVGLVAVAVAVGFVAIEVISMRTSQLAVEDGTDPTAIVTASMGVAALAMFPFAVTTEAGVEASTLVASAVAAAVVAVLGTVGRVLRTTALPAAGVPAVAASTQVAALGTAVGGIVLFGDHIGPVSVACAVLAAALGATAVVAGTRYRLTRDRTLAAPLDLPAVPAVE